MATCEIPGPGNDLYSVGADGDFKNYLGNISGYGNHQGAPDIAIALGTGQSYDMAGGWGLTVTSAGVKIRWDTTGHGMQLAPDGSITHF